MAEGGVEDVGENTSQFCNAVVKHRWADIVWAGCFVPLDSPEGAPNLLLLDGERGRGGGVDGGGDWGLFKLPTEGVEFVWKLIIIIRCGGWFLFAVCHVLKFFPD